MTPGRDAETERRASWLRRKERPAPVGSVVDAVLDRIGVRERLERARTAARWEEVVGSHIRRVTRVRGVRGRTLFVEVAGAAWMTELDMMRRELLRRLNEDRDRGRIERIMLVQAEDGDASSEPGRERYRRGRG